MVHDSIGAGGQPRLLSGNLSNFIGGTRESEIPAAVFFIFLFASPPGCHQSTLVLRARPLPSWIAFLFWSVSIKKRPILISKIVFYSFDPALGVFRIGTEIIPFEPDPGHTGEGKSNAAISVHIPFGKIPIALL